MKVALACIAKDEDNYIEEWLKYNFKLGFDDIFIYQNNWRCNIEMDNLHKIDFDGYGIQTPAYNNFLQTYHDRYDWVAFFDVDEFLVLKKHKNIKDFMEEYSNHDAIGINWVLFGDNGLTFDGDYSVLSRFTKRENAVNVHIKCIVKADKNIQYSVHNPTNCRIVTTDHNTIIGPFNENGKDDVAQLNHYFCKTREEWKFKRLRGGGYLFHPDHPDFYRPDSTFDAHNFNDVEDTTALNFYLS
jgi:hypothetical protein